MAVSGRAGLFTIDDRFFYDLRGSPYTADKRQKSGALRLEFGQVRLASAGTLITTTTTIPTGIMAVVTPGKLPTNTTSLSGGSWNFAASSFLSGALSIDIEATGNFSGQQSGISINYIVVGY